ncbi:hypothetical protein ACHAXN_009677 [Cyclotella atomus]|jgi:hypothetical protein
MTMAFESTETIAIQPHDTKAQSTIEPDEDVHSNSDVSDGLSTEPDSPVENNDQVDRADEIPDGDSNADLHALLAYSKNRLEKQAEMEAAAPSVDNEPAEITDDEVEGSSESNGDMIADDTIQRSNSDEEQLVIAKAKMAEAEAKAAADDDEMEALREEARRAQQLAAANDTIAEEVENDPAHMLRLAEMKVRQAEEKARKDEEATGVNVIKPAVSTTKRSEANSELWALLNYSKVRLETGATPQLGKKKESSRGDDVSVSSKGTKSSKTSKKSIASRSIASGSKASASEVGVLDGSAQNDATGKNEGDDVPFPDVTGEDDASVEGSVSGDDEQDSLNDSDDDDSESESEEEEEDLPSFLKDDNEEEEAIDPAEQKRLYEEAKFKAASILSVDENLTEVQMLQAMAIAVEAANNGEDKFSTKRSLFKLNEAKLEDLKSFLDFSGMNNRARVAEENKAQTTEREQVGWGIGRGRLMKKLGAAFQDLKERCDEIDERKQKERQGQLTHTEMFNAAFDDLKKQIDEYEKIVKSKK